MKKSLFYSLWTAGILFLLLTSVLTLVPTLVFAGTGNSQVAEQAGQLNAKYQKLFELVVGVKKEFSDLENKVSSKIANKVALGESWGSWGFRKVWSTAHLEPFKSSADYYHPYVLERMKHFPIELEILKPSFDNLFNNFGNLHSSSPSPGSPVSVLAQIAEAQWSDSVRISKPIFNILTELKISIRDGEERLQKLGRSSAEAAFLDAFIDSCAELFQNVHDLQIEQKRVARSLKFWTFVSGENESEAIDADRGDFVGSPSISAWNDATSYTSRKEHTHTVKLKKRRSDSTESMSPIVQTPLSPTKKPLVEVDPEDLRSSNHGHLEVFSQIFERSKNVRMKAFENAWTSINNCKIEERAGSSIAFLYKGTRAFVLHRPHPNPEMYPALVKRAILHLEDCGITPDTLNAAISQF